MMVRENMCRSNMYRMPRGPKPPQINLSEKQQTILKRIEQSRQNAHSLVTRAKIILQASTGKQNQYIAEDLQVHVDRVRRWRGRWIEKTEWLQIIEDEGNERDIRQSIAVVLADKARGGAPGTFTAEAICKIIAMACEPPEEYDRPVTNWTGKELADEAVKQGIVESISRRQVSRYLEESDLKPHRSQYWLNNKRDENPEQFDADVKKVCDLYEKAPELHEEGVHVVSSDEKTSIQALERIAETKPMRPGQIERREFEYERHGTLALIANFEVATGEVVAPSLGPTRNEADFAAHVEQTIATDPEASWIFLVDQLNTHKSKTLVRLVADLCGINEELGVKGKEGILKSMLTRADFLQNEEHRIRFVYLPKHTSWLNQIEIWFGILTRRVLKRGHFKTLQELHSMKRWPSHLSGHTKDVHWLSESAT